MKHHHATLGAIALVGIVLATTPSTLAQAAPETPAPVYTPTSLVPEADVPRTPSGHPDLQTAVWTTNFFPVFEANPMSDTLVVSEEKAAEMTKMFVGRFLGSDNPNVKIDAEATTFIGETDGLPIVRGERRARLVVLPADGKLPLTEAAREELKTIDPMERPMDNPEQRPLPERCIIQAAPPIASTLETNFIQFTQTDTHVLIHSEYGDDVRIIPFTDKHQTGPFHPWLGDSIARWDGDTLEIETINNPKGERVRILPSIIVDPGSTVVERYTRLSKDELLYQYTVIDPEVYTEPWLAEHSLYRSDSRMYPHDCHEGNYSLPNILKGARMAELRAGRSH